MLILIVGDVVAKGGRKAVFSALDELEAEYDIDLVIVNAENAPLMDNVQKLIPIFEAGMNALADHPNIGEIRGKGLMGALEAVADKETKTPFAGELSVSERIANMYVSSWPFMQS